MHFTTADIKNRLISKNYFYLPVKTKTSDTGTINHMETIKYPQSLLPIDN
jgi:hypothetical protein